MLEYDKRSERALEKQGKLDEKERKRTSPGGKGTEKKRETDKEIDKSSEDLGLSFLSLSLSHLLPLTLHEDSGQGTARHEGRSDKEGEKGGGGGRRKGGEGERVKRFSFRDRSGERGRECAS